MSVAFEAVVLTRETAEQIGEDSLSAMGEIAESQTLVAVLTNAAGDGSMKAALLAEQLSHRPARTVAVYYDDRVGVREGVVFEGGSLTASFGAESEEWVPLDDEGNANISAVPVSIAELSEDVEAECVVSAIDRALASLGASTVESRELLRAIRAA